MNLVYTCLVLNCYRRTRKAFNKRNIQNNGAKSKKNVHYTVLHRYVLNIDISTCRVNKAAEYIFNPYWSLHPALKHLHFRRVLFTTHCLTFHLQGMQNSGKYCLHISMWPLPAYTITLNTLWVVVLVKFPMQ